jgi:alpha-L-rhamnosidase
VKKALLSLVLLCAVAQSLALAADSMEESFRTPPASAKPLIIWQWMNGVVSREGITADLEAFHRAGLGGVQNFQIGGPRQALADDPSVQIGNEKWRGLMRFAMDECARLGLSFGTHNCPGWSSSASPEVKPEDSMQKLVWTETKVSGPAAVALKIKQPEVDPKWDCYRDIAVLALPDLPEAPAESVIDLTAKMNADGALHWDAPEGPWVILRFGHTTTGKTNESQSPTAGVGLECDKFSRAAVEKYWAGYPATLLGLAGKNAGASFTRIEIDSYEAGPQDWTPAMFEEFKKYRGYDLRPWLPALAGKTLGGKNLTERFKRDWKQTTADIFADNYYLFMGELARRTPGMNLLVQPYGTSAGAMLNTPSAAGGDNLLSAEFWTEPAKWTGNNVGRVTSAAHTWGRPLVVAEAFTCWPLSAWRDDPYALKPVGDLMFAAGVNLFMLHAGAQNPWPGAKPGMTMGMWGTQFTPGQTWWEHGGPEWLAYLARCQSLLQRGIFVGDVCFLVEDGTKELPPEGYAGDACGEREFLTRMSVKDGRLVMPDGVSYGVLVLPNTWKMTLPVARKLRQLVQEGAVVVGRIPTGTPGLENYPASEAELKKIAGEVWGDSDGKTVKEHRFGRGRVIWGSSPADVLMELGVQPDLRFDAAEGLRWIHRRDGEADVYFISNQKDRPAAASASFRVTGRRPELWHADTGLMEPAPHWQRNDARTDVRLDLDPYGSVFVVFRHVADESGPGLEKAATPQPDALAVDGPWILRFPSGWGAPEKVTLDRLASWTENEDAGVKHFSGTAAYETDVDVPAAFIAAGRSVTLDLGEVKNIAEVLVNGARCGGALWKPPFRADLGHALKPGKNHLEIRVTNLWVNRMVGDEFEPDDCDWGEPFHYSYAPGNPVIGRQLARVPQWLIEGKPRPSSGRRTFVSFKFFTKDSPLLPSGLLGPVKLESTPSAH